MLAQYKEYPEGSGHFLWNDKKNEQYDFFSLMQDMKFVLMICIL